MAYLGGGGRWPLNVLTEANIKRLSVNFFWKLLGRAAVLRKGKSENIVHFVTSLANCDGRDYDRLHK